MGATMISVINVAEMDEKVAILEGLQVPEGRTVTTISNIMARMDKGLEEVEEAWASRDKGFNAAWISDALYKAGNSENEHPGAIIKSMKAKSSLFVPVSRSALQNGSMAQRSDHPNQPSPCLSHACVSMILLPRKRAIEHED